MNRRQRESERWAIKFVVITGLAISLAASVMAGIIIVKAPSHGTVHVAGNSIRYQPEPGYIGNDHFVYKFNGLTPTIVTEGQTTLVFDENHKEYQIPVTLTVHEDGTREVTFGEPQN